MDGWLAGWLDGRNRNFSSNRLSEISTPIAQMEKLRLRELE